MLRNRSKIILETCVELNLFDCLFVNKLQILKTNEEYYVTILYSRLEKKKKNVTIMVYVM